MVLWTQGNLQGGFSQHYFWLLGQMPDLLAIAALGCITAGLVWMRTQKEPSATANAAETFE